MNFPNGPIDVCEHIQPLLQTHLRERTCSQLAIQSSKPNFNFLPPNDVKNSHILPTGQWYAPSAVINDALIMH